MNLVHPEVDRYLARLAEPSDPVLREMEKLGTERGFPIVGPQVGAMLEVLAAAIGARRVLELGSGFGYSAYWFARAVGPDGLVVLTEGSAQRAEEARVSMIGGRHTLRSSRTNNCLSKGNRDHVPAQRMSPLSDSGCAARLAEGRRTRPASYQYPLIPDPLDSMALTASFTAIVASTDTIISLSRRLPAACIFSVPSLVTRRQSG